MGNQIRWKFKSLIMLHVSKNAQLIFISFLNWHHSTHTGMHNGMIYYMVLASNFKHKFLAIISD